MNEELQTAYNEWLLKYGFRWVNASVLNVERPLFWWTISANTMNKYVRYSIRMRKYQLKTPKEIKNEQ
jgi:hypothetical protein